MNEQIKIPVNIVNNDLQEVWRLQTIGKCGLDINWKPSPCIEVEDINKEYIIKYFKVKSDEYDDVLEGKVSLNSKYFNYIIWDKLYTLENDGEKYFISEVISNE